MRKSRIPGTWFAQLHIQKFERLKVLASPCVTDEGETRNQIHLKVRDLVALKFGDEGFRISRCLAPRAKAQTYPSHKLFPDLP